MRLPGAARTGLGGTTDWRGLPWVMSMEQFYEAWVETVFARYTRRHGGLLRIGRRRETITPIAWERAFHGSQKFLMPDLVIEQDSRNGVRRRQIQGSLGGATTAAVARLGRRYSGEASR
jgi:hypothetical protein